MARRLLISLLLLSSLGFVALAQVRTGLPKSLEKRLNDSRVAMLPPVLPPISDLEPLEQARAQALLDFLHSQRIYAQGGCDARRDLCLPVFIPDEAAAPLPLEAAGLLHPPLESSVTEADARDLIYVVQAGEVIYAPYDGSVLTRDTLSGGRTLLTFTHDQIGGMRVFSILTGQIATDVQIGEVVRKGQPVGRARPIRDASTRLTFSMIRSDQQLLDPQDWLIRR